ncbi:tRNA (pseudouridine(54)-N(1))-methyltransferase TrmY [Salarchaeum sp. JOR-1]|uniref:tRNA (pseudouridine(54)-N(1))-methyltransferase TrmY n=1 Tax=Salarchaeum sp. JOR-1 TaxID=2599399 RepID=UPI001198AA01|nr:tRNA (pseudouridine(54)-N(1))-methyltransferase TrmY [Salarchaeum sp. JOR-1]QDX40513.1 tRNA (pseudouridine(54)-N(1))-methyltransferase TrmY [Salarchaeum sp. JOR-1]
MREFIVLGHDAPTDADFSLDSLPNAGRLDLLCRCIGAGVFLSHDIREAVQVHLVLQDELTVRFDSRTLRNARPDERNLAGLVRNALDHTNEAIGHREAEPSPGVHVSKRGFEPTLDRLTERATVVHLHEDGQPLADAEPPEHPAFVLSDHNDFSEREADILAGEADQRVRVGPHAIHADHAIAVANNYLDTDAYTTY